MIPAKQEFTTTEAAAILDMSRPSLMKLIHAGRIGFRKVGRHHRVPATAIQAFRDHQRKRAQQPSGAGRASQSGRATRLSLSVALADANVLISRTLRDYIVYTAEAGAMQLHWSQPILDEISRNLVAKFGFTAADAAELELRLTEYLPRALIEVHRRDTRLVAKVDMDAKDRHVVAAALSAKTTILVTDNARHFPTDWLAKRKIELLTPAQLLTRLAADRVEALRTAHRLTVANSPKAEGRDLRHAEVTDRRESRGRRSPRSRRVTAHPGCRKVTKCDDGLVTFRSILVADVMPWRASPAHARRSREGTRRLVALGWLCRMEGRR